MSSRFISIPTVVLLGFAASCRTPPGDPAPQSADLATDLIGTWAMVGTPGHITEAASDTGRLKFRTGRHWTLTYADPVTGKVLEHDGGTYTVRGDEYVETVEYANPGTYGFVGKTYRFRVEVAGDRMTQIGIDNPFREVWERVR